MHLHLDLAGGTAGDTFIAAILDAFPRFEEPVIAAIDALDGPYPVACSLVFHSDGESTGRRFQIEPFDQYFGHIPIAFPVLSHGDCVSHEQATWESVRERLHAADIERGVRRHAMSIFERLVEAESSTRGIQPDRVAFQEAGAWDAIAEIVGAAALIHALPAVRWTASPPPCPELITPTGAAIVGYLCPQGSVNGDSPQVRALFGSGTGFAARGRSSNNSRMRVHRIMTHTLSAVAERFGRQIGP
jgi:uncharacterized protein (DUF111 family)